MPIYEFVCRNCHHEFEQILSFSATSMPNCPNCSSSEVERRVGRPAIHFKGSGWYITDSKASKDSANATTKTTEKTTDKASDKASSDSSTATPASETKSESKGETKEKSTSVESAS
ncbi:MAG: zinc ribbon domain-containing protein [Caldilineaceae bacterium]|nr:zinc ribbon domain-containing protein [Caldilineaceae bacterium]